MKKVLFAALLSLVAGVCLAADRRILVLCSEKADPAIRKATESLAESPVFKAMIDCGGAAAEKVDFMASEKLLPDSAFRLAAFNHLVVVGLPEQDALLKKCWGHQIGLRPGGLDVLGYGKWKGDFGTVECDWNPFLYSEKVKTNGFSTVLVKISGTSVAGVLKAVKAFDAGMLNGIVPAGKGALEETSILDLAPDDTPPPALLAKAGAFVRAGWTQPSAIEYRAYIDLGGAEPKRIWRVKYLAPKTMDDVSAKGWVNGLHRMAYGNAATIAEFKDAAEAKKTFDALSKRPEARRVKLGPADAVIFPQPKDEAMKESYGSVWYIVAGARVVSLSLPEKESAEVASAL